MVIASITWDFAVAWCADRLGVRRSLGTRLDPSGEIGHVWPRDKGAFVRSLRSELAVPEPRVAAVGDSSSDEELLSSASLRFFVGHATQPALRGLLHRPAGDIEDIAREILSAWAR